MSNVNTRENGLQGSRYYIIFNYNEDQERKNDNRSPDIEMMWDGETVTKTLNNELSVLIAKRLYLNFSHGGCLTFDSVVHCFTEYRKDNGSVFRAHPSYRKTNNEWLDWCLVQWDGIEKLIPAKILTFLDLSGCSLMTPQQQSTLRDWLNLITDDTTTLNKNHLSSDNTNNDRNDPINEQNDRNHQEYLTLGQLAVIRSAMSPEEEALAPQVPNNINKFSMTPDITTRYRLEKNCRIVPLNSIAGPAFCVPITTKGTHKDCDLFLCV
eukprot:CAMPEP_0202454364 /NCGR_PEP_ID=MMETSP1360-20130828/12124_1 /ASSEMBLY_ACC=CAM_ASM_000848 /TAXON_ID=515479 /ORGANISM="Licmophora paradoxa, Strain CCMP2313" /LENGTH=266 /DNA_ID=CAMNT_0049073667 /DNA_START=673 /DNA_END=1470 /DNA_ORIENTATION=-